ncbi:MAG: hypothetical protein M1814_003915 [Vezdaea aestivalis]|nr:MAG: hypothetical protein M1814_003915 [Vezdaea aestivalis]
MQSQAHTVSRLSWEVYNAEAPAERRRLTAFVDAVDLSLLPLETGYSRVVEFEKLVESQEQGIKPHWYRDGPNYRATEEGKQGIAIQRRSEYASCLIGSEPDWDPLRLNDHNYACFPIELLQGPGVAISRRGETDLQLGSWLQVPTAFHTHPFAICRSFVHSPDHSHPDPIHCFIRIYRDLKLSTDLLCFFFELSWVKMEKMKELSHDYSHWERFMSSLSPELHQEAKASEKSDCIKQEIIRKLCISDDKGPLLKMGCWRMFLGGCFRLMDYAINIDDDLMSSTDPFNNDEFKVKAERFLGITGFKFPIEAVSIDRVQHVIECEFFKRTIDRILLRHPRNPDEYSKTRAAFAIYHKDQLNPTTLSRLRIGEDLSGHSNEPRFENGVFYYLSDGSRTNQSRRKEEVNAIAESAQASLGEDFPSVSMLCDKFNIGSFMRRTGPVIEILDGKNSVLGQCICLNIACSSLQSIPLSELDSAYDIKALRQLLLKYQSRNYLIRNTLPQMNSSIWTKVQERFQGMIYSTIGEQSPQPRHHASLSDISLLEVEAQRLVKASGFARGEFYERTLSALTNNLTPALARRLIGELLNQVLEWAIKVKSTLEDESTSTSFLGGLFPLLLEINEASFVLSAIVDAFQEAFEDVAKTIQWPCFAWDKSVEHLKTEAAKESKPNTGEDTWPYDHQERLFYNALYPSNNLAKTIHHASFFSAISEVYRQFAAATILLYISSADLSSEVEF